MLRPLAPIVPPLNVSGRALMVVIAIMSFLCAITLGAVTMVQEKAEAWQGDVSREITIQIKPTDDIDIESTLLEVRDLTLSFPGTQTAQIVDRSSTARLLEPWLGEGFRYGRVARSAAGDRDHRRDLTARFHRHAPGACRNRPRRQALMITARGPTA
jgi:cell division protein FtsX